MPITHRVGQQQDRNAEDEQQPEVRQDDRDPGDPGAHPHTQDDQHQPAHGLLQQHPPARPFGSCAAATICADMPITRANSGEARSLMLPDDESDGPGGVP